MPSACAVLQLQPAGSREAGAILLLDRRRERRDPLVEATASEARRIDGEDQLARSRRPSLVVEEEDASKAKWAPTSAAPELRP